MELRGTQRPPYSRRMRPGWVFGLVGLVGALVVVAGCGGRPASLRAAPTQTEVPKISGATYVANDVCKGCHEDKFKEMENTLHGKLLGTKLSKGALQPQGCQACHGPGSKHIENPGPTTIIVLGKGSFLPAPEQGAVCLQCHERGKRILWAGSPHDSRDVVCETCHSVHSPKSKKAQLQKETEMALCAQCHQAKTAQFQRSSHMPASDLGEAGSLVCTSCHNPHGSTTDHLINAISTNDLCTSCHADKRGPFLWVHPPVMEDCMNCHQPHGSNNAPLLRLKPPRLCQRCHDTNRHPTNPYTPSSRYVFNASCLNCHSNIHGSNAPSGMYFTR